ncbi:uncharacterized protein LOC107983764 isoform X2 [Anolis carolinensis]|uniref:uncharacterized protein LOC107983764 isoform X2 n=1 Tax=Anolis carolinensis TaxID=28377 RepID=UPI002F2B2B50
MTRRGGRIPIGGSWTFGGKERRRVSVCLCRALFKCREAPPLCGHPSRGCHVRPGRKSSEEGRPLPREAEDERGRVSALPEERVSETKEEEGGGGVFTPCPSRPEGDSERLTEPTMLDYTINKDRQHRQR